MVLETKGYMDTILVGCEFYRRSLYNKYDIRGNRPLETNKIFYNNFVVLCENKLKIFLIIMRRIV